MSLKFTSVIFLLLFASNAAMQAQEIDNTASYKNIASNSYVRLTTDNDYFTGTDEQYTEGVNFELVMPWIRQFPLSDLLVHPHFSDIRYGIGIEQAGYTPNNLGNETLQLYDRPYAGTLFLKTFLIATDTKHKQRFTTTLSTGIMGPAALGSNIQDAVHALIHDVLPTGWEYQVRNDAIVNYQADYQKQLFSLGNVFLADAEGTARAGTLSDKAGIGLDFMLGRFSSPFSDNMPLSPLQIYVFDNPEVDIVGYDATLEGGVFNHSSIYTIPPSQLSRTTFMNRGGIIINYKRVYVEYDVYTLTKQFSTGPNHAFGTIQLAITLKNKSS